MAISSLNAIFSNDSSKIISTIGEIVLSDKEEMRRINKVIKKSQNDDAYNIIII